MIIDSRPEAEQFGIFAIHALAKFRACLTMKARGVNVNAKTLDTWERRVHDWTVEAARAARKGA